MNSIPTLDKAGLRNFAFTTGTAVAVLFGLFLPWLFDLTFATWPWIVMAILFAWGALLPDTLQPVYKGWMRLALLLSKVTTPIILGLIFVVLFLPVAVIFRLIGRDPMFRKIDPAASSYKIVSTQPDERSLEKPF